MDAAELDLLRDALSDLVAAHADDLCAALDDFGWADLVEQEAAAAVDTVFRLQGTHLTAPTMLDDVLARALDPTAAAMVSAVLLPLPPSPEPESAYGNAGVQVDGLLTHPVDMGATVLVAARAVDGVCLLAVPVAGLDQTPAGELDPRRPWTRLRGCVPAGAADHVGDAEAWRRVVAAGRRALAAELVALGDRMLLMAVEHTSTRHQFGQPLASFQVVRHKLADVRLWGEVADLAAGAAWEDEDPAAAALAKSAAARYTACAREHVQQLLGGMGFSWEHDLHWYIRRALVLEPLLGGPGVVRAEIGSAIKESGRLPDLAAL